MLRLASAVVVVAMLFVAPAARARQRAPIPTTCFGLAATIDDHEGEIVGTPGDDVIIGDNGPNVIYGGGGRDYICSNGGDDQIDAGEPLLCTAANDSDELYADAGAGNDSVGSYCGRHNELHGGPGSDGLQGSLSVAGPTNLNYLDGGPGNDHLRGYGGTDTMQGGPGNDKLHGGPGDDWLQGDVGRDELYGDEGVDRLDGGTSQTKRKHHKARQDKDLCQVGPDGGTTVNCEREV